MFRDHQPLVYPVPPCSDGDHFYYKEKRLSLTRTEDVGKRLKAVLRKKQEYFVFHWRGGYLNKDVLDDIMKQADAVAAEKEKYIRLSLNFAQAVLEIHIKDKQDFDEICMEKPDEAEEAE